MKTPKMLPWLARKAGLSDARAEVLWAQAVTHASLTIRGSDPLEHNNFAVARLLELIETEKEAIAAQQKNGNVAPTEERAEVQSRGRWPYSLIVAMKPVSEESARGAVLAS